MKSVSKAFLALTLLLSTASWGQAAGGAAVAPARRPRVALVLSGGFALGMAHIGVIEEIERAGIPIDMVLGTSMGAIVGGLYAAGYSPARMEAIVDTIDWNEIFNEQRDNPGDSYYQTLEGSYPLRIGFGREGIDTSPGLLRGQNVLSFFTELTLHDLTVHNFDELPVPYRAVAADIITGDKVVFRSGSLAEAMRASMSIPGLFRPYEIGGRVLVDGGIVDNMPVDVARSMGADIVIAVESQPTLAKEPGELKSALDVTTQTLGLFIEENMRQSRAEADLLIVPDLQGLTRMSYGEADELVRRGRLAGERAKPELEALAARIAAERPLVKPEEQANRRAYREPPIIARLIVQGAGPGDEIIARASFAPLVGRRVDRAQVKAAVDGLFATGRFDFVKLDLQALPGSGGDLATGLLSLVPDSPPNNVLLLGGDVRLVVSSRGGFEGLLSPGLLLRNLSGKDSAFFLDGSFVSRTGIYAEYFQPIGDFFINPFGRVQSRYDSYSIGDRLSFDSPYRDLGGGTWAGLRFSRVAELRFLWSFESLDCAAGRTQAASLGGELRADTRHVSIFPEDGAYGALFARWADPAFGGQLSFVTAECDFGGSLPLSKALSLGIAGFAGTDFRGWLPVGDDLPPEAYFSLRRAGMFYGLEPQPNRGLGEHVAALALELRDHVGELNQLLGGDLFAFVNVSAGVAKVEDDPSLGFLPLRLDASLGLGARLSASLGLLVATSLMSDGSTGAALRPALTLELGTFESESGNRR